MKTAPEQRWVKVTPALAEEWLNKNTVNRKLTEGIVEKYARDMTDGHWTRNPQPIIFCSDDTMADGQHRLWAVVISGCTVDFFVHFGVDPSVRLNIDTGRVRDLVDNAKISGYEGFISKQALGTMMIVAFGREVREKALSNAERIELLERYVEDIRYSETVATLKKRGIAPAPVRAAVARAHMHLGDNARLNEFCAVLNSGIPQSMPADRSALTFRNYMLEIKAGHKLDPRDTFLKAMNAIDYFMRRKPLTVIKVVKDEAYPLKGAEPKIPSLPKRKLAALEEMPTPARAA